MIGVIGATGNVGSALVRELVGAGEQVVAVSSGHGEPKPGVEYRIADVTSPPTVATALAGARAVFVLAPVDAHHRLDPAALLRAVVETGAERIVVLSSLGTVSRPDAPGYAPLRHLEEATQQCGVATTILRPTGFASNTLGWIHGIRAARTVAAPFGDVAIPIVDPADIAAVAAVALRTPGHAGAVYELTGPAPITPRAQAAALATVLETSLTFVEVSREQAAAEMVKHIPQDLVDATLDIAGTPNATERRVSPDMNRVLGRPATPYVTWARRNAAAFR